MLLFISFIGCSFIPGKSEAEPPPTYKVEPVQELSKRVKVEFSADKTAVVAQIGLTVTVLDSKDALLLNDDGSKSHRTTGRVKVELGGESMEIDYVGDKGFEAFGYNMGVFGGAMSPYLSISPKGQAARP